MGEAQDLPRPNDASRRGIGDEDLTEIYNNRGRTRAHAVLDPGCRESTPHAATHIGEDHLVTEALKRPENRADLTWINAVSVRLVHHGTEEGIDVMPLTGRSGDVDQTCPSCVPRESRRFLEFGSSLGGRPRMNAIEILVEEQLREPERMLRSANGVSSVPTMKAGLVALATSIDALLRSRASLHLKIPALRDQLAVLQGGERRPRLKPAARLLWVWLSRAWPGLGDALVLVNPSVNFRCRPGAIHV